MSDPVSPLDAALARIGDRWTLLIVDVLQRGPARFNELSEALPGIAPNTLSSRLRRLEEEGIVIARLYSERPPRSVYELTAPGAELAGALRLLSDWGSRHSASEGVRHDPCGTPLEARWYCPTCDRRVDAPAAQGEVLFL